MSDYTRNFPPQTYSSSFYINSLVDGEANILAKPNETDGNMTKGSPLLNCFISTTNENKLEITELWNEQERPTRSQSPHNAFKRWKIRSNLKSAESKNALIGSKMAAHSKDREKNDMSLLKFLAINALDLSAPASDILLKSRYSNWFQLSGHPDSLAPAGPGTVWKKRSPNTDDTERIVYEEVTQDPNLCDIIPQYYREVEYQGEKFIELQDLLHGFQDPFVIDIKMGTRTFLESEVQKSIARTDLYQKMVAIDHCAPTKDEHENKAVTKLRYMQFRELQSSSCSHGFRIEAMKCRGLPPVTNLKKVKSPEQIFNTLDMFLGGKENVIQRLLARLCEIRSKIEQSYYFKIREVVGSSLFIIYDDDKVGVWLIDFAKTNKLPEGITVNHRTPWIQGNHEEGLLFGFDKLISIIEGIKNPLSKRAEGCFSKSVPAGRVKS